MSSIKTWALILIFLSIVVFADPSLISNLGGAAIGTIDGNVSVGTTQSLGKLHVNGSIYQGVPTSLRVIGTVTGSLDGTSDVYVQGKYAYIANYGNDSMVIIDVSNPASPTVVGKITDSRRLNGAHSVVVSGMYAYTTSYDNQSFSVIDVSNASNPRRISYMTNSSIFSGTRDLYVSGQYAYVVGEGSDTFSIIDVSSIASPRVVGNITNSRLLDGARDVFVSGKHAFVPAFTNKSLTIIDISNATNPVIVGNLANNTNFASIDSVFVSGRYAYVTAFDSIGFSIVDVSNVSVPFIVGNLTHSLLPSSRDVFVAGKYAYVSSQDGNRFVVIDVSNVSSPRIVATAEGITIPVGNFISGKYAYVAAYGDNGLKIIELSGIDSPAASIGAVETGSLSVTENAVIGNDLYAGNGLGVGPGGIYSQGPVSIFVNAANSVTAALNVILTAEDLSKSSFVSTSLFFIGASGNVGINTTTPRSLLHVVGNANITGTLYSGGCVGCTVSNRMLAQESFVCIIEDHHVVPAMNFTVGFNQTWGYEFYLSVNSSDAQNNDIQFDLNAPSQSNCIYSVTGTAGTIVDAGWQSSCATPVTYNISTTQPDGAVFHGTIVTGNLSGVVKLQGQSTCGVGGGADIVGGYFVATRIV